MATDSTHREGILSEWAERNRVVARELTPGCMIVPDRNYGIEENWKIYHLADHFVSSVQAGSVYLLPITTADR